MTAQAMTTHKLRAALITGITGQDGAYLAEFLLLMRPQPWYPVAAVGLKADLPKASHVGRASARQEYKADPVGLASAR